MGRMLSAARPIGLVLLPRLVALVALVALATGCSSDTKEPIPDQLDSGFDFIDGAYTFENFARNSQGYALTADSVARMFGAKLVCENKKLPCRPTTLAATWIEGVNQTLYEGRSEGFAVSSLLFSMGELDPRDFGAKTVAGLRVQNNPALQAELAYWAATQAVPSAVEQDQRFSAADVMPFLAKVLQPDHDERYRLAIAQKTPEGFVRGHAMVPMGYFRGYEPGQYFLRVYDSNFPEKERLLEIDAPAGTWRYEVPLPNGDVLVYEGTKDNGNLLYFSPVTPRTGKLGCPFGEDSTTATLSSVGKLHVTAASGDEDSAGIQDGELVETGTGRAMPAFSNCPLCNAPRGIMNYTLPAKSTKPVSVLISAGVAMDAENPAGGAQLNITGPNFTTSVKGIKGDANDTDQIVVDPKKGKVTYTSESESSVEIASTITSGKVQTTVSVKVDGGSSEITLGVDDAGRPVVEHSGVDKGTSITVSITTVAADGVETTKDVVYQATGMDAELRLDPSSGEVTTMNIRSIENGSCYNGVHEPMFERDVDCGGSCSTLCGLDKRCSADADCQGEAKCIGLSGGDKTCRMEGCGDEVKNGKETDVDCGGGTCDACESTAWATKNCKQDSDCTSGGLCITNTDSVSMFSWKGCALVQPVRVRVQGGRAGTQLVFATTADGTSQQRTLNIDSADQTAKLLDAHTYALSISKQPEASSCSIDEAKPPTTWAATGTTGYNELGNSSERTIGITCTPTHGALSVAVSGLPTGARVGLSRTFDSASSVSVEQTGNIPLGFHVGAWSLEVTGQPGLVDPTDFTTYTECAFAEGTTASGTLVATDTTSVALTCAAATCPANVCNTDGNLNVSVSGLPAGATLDLTTDLDGTAGNQQFTQDGSSLLGELDGSYQLDITTAAGVYAVTGGTAHIDCNFSGGGKTASGEVDYQNETTEAITCVSNMCPHALCPLLTGDLAVNVTGLPDGGTLSFDTTLDGAASTLDVMANGDSSVGNFAGDYQLDITTAAGIYTVTGGEALMDCAFTGPTATASGTLSAGDDVTLQVTCTATACPSAACDQPCTTDGDCVSGSCYCGANSGECTGDTGECTPTGALYATPVSSADTASGTFTVPASCDQLYIHAWGAAGGPAAYDDFGFVTYTGGGAGGYAGGIVSVVEGDVVSVWVGQGGEVANASFGAGGTASIGSNLGVDASGGLGDGDAFAGGAGGGGGGLTSVQITGSATLSFVVPGGGGAAHNFPGGDVGGVGAGTEATSAGASADFSSQGGGGGAGELGGAGATQVGDPGLAGSYGTLPGGISSQDGADSMPANTAVNDYYNLCFSASMGGLNPGDSSGFNETEYGGDGCVSLRCVEVP